MTQIPKNASDLFDVMVPELLKKYPDKAKEVAAIFGFKVLGEGGGEWTVDLTTDPPTCVPGDSGNAQCTIEVSNDDFQTMIANPQIGMQLYFQGKLKVSGDPMVATKLTQFFTLAQQQ